jgi:flagellar protein FliS
MNPYAVYKKQSVSTMTPIEIVVKGYYECERQLNRAVHYIQAKEHVQAHNCLDKAGELITAFRAALDMKAGGEISENLDALYDFFFRQIIDADIKKDASVIEAILPQIAELRDAFTQISTTPKEGVLVRGNILSGING